MIPIQSLPRKEIHTGLHVKCLLLLSYKVQPSPLHAVEALGEAEKAFLLLLDLGTRQE
jgi:hypothetical protein